ncbi:MAG: hypothetical protein AB7I59_09700 [Geminicoccaceae bacterium]
MRTDRVVGRRIVLTAPAEVSGRVNALHMTVTFAGGAVGSVPGTVT